ncbi:MAG: hypothetical protein H7A24_02040 [Leptospiraceae bacterium]|nr:hypothetical protein [Leptospiraceae bacterium]MCP5510630.1 hypothetical protein [Leptospiraceae bacterium]
MDQSSGEYSLISLGSIPKCPELLNAGKGHVFTMTFERLKKESRVITVTEDFTQPSQSSAWSWWIWKDISLEDCPFTY